jgi:chromosome segregation protein
MPRSLKKTGVGPKRKRSAKVTAIENATLGPASEPKRPRQREAEVDRIVATMEAGAEVPHDGATIVSIIKGLEEQIETAFKLKQVVEADLEATQQKLSEQSAKRAEFEVRVDSLEARAALVDRLREDIAFTEQERDKSAQMLADTQQQLEEVTEEREALSEEAAAAQARAEEFEGEKTALEAQVMNLGDKVLDLDRVRGELAEATEARRDLGEQVRDLSRRLETSEATTGSLEADLAEAGESLHSLREELAEFRKKHSVADSQLADLRLQLEEQERANRDLLKTRARLESEIRTSKVDHATAKSELEAVMGTLREVYTELTGTSKRVRHRYSKEMDDDPNAARAVLREVATELNSTTARARRQRLDAEDAE